VAGGFTAATIKLMADKGLTAHDIAELAAANENRADHTAAERQARRRAKVKSQRDVTRDPPNDIISNPQTTSVPEVVTATPKPKTKSEKGSRLPDDFAVPADWIDWAIERRHWSRADAIAEGEKFCRHWRAKTGRDAAKRDWLATWQNWVDGSFRPNGTTPDRSARPFNQAEYEARLAKIGRTESTGPPRPIGKLASGIMRGVGNG